MGKTRTKSRSNSVKDILHSTSTPIKSAGRSKYSSKSTEDLVNNATQHLEQSQPDLALPLIDEALKRLEAQREQYANADILLRRAAQGQLTFPEVLVIGAQIYLANGEVGSARTLFNRAIKIDVDGLLISAEPWLELAQLCEEGGQKSIDYMTKATQVLRKEIDSIEESAENQPSEEREQSLEVVQEKRMQLAEALCAMAEVYMTDLSWEEDAEARCENLVTEAVAICPERLSAGTLQTLASVRISQEKYEEAREALVRSMAIWKDLPEDIDDAAKPDFATRVSLTRLLMEVEAEVQAMAIVEGLVKEDDQSVESLYLGGYCQVILSERSKDAEIRQKHQEQAKLWLANCLKLSEVQKYEDVRLIDHAIELNKHLNQALGISEEDDEWEDEDEDEEPDNNEGNEVEVMNNGQASHHDDDDDVEMT